MHRVFKQPCYRSIPSFSAADAAHQLVAHPVGYGALVGGLIGWGAAGRVGAWAGVRAGVEAVAKHETGFTDEHIRRIAHEIPKGHVAVIALIEHHWISDFRQAITDAGADFFAEGMIRPEALVKVGAELAAAGTD